MGSRHEHYATVGKKTPVTRDRKAWPAGLIHPQRTRVPLVSKLWARPRRSISRGSEYKGLLRRGNLKRAGRSNKTKKRKGGAKSNLQGAQRGKGIRKATRPRIVKGVGMTDADVAVSQTVKGKRGREKLADLPWVLATGKRGSARVQGTRR